MLKLRICCQRQSISMKRQHDEGGTWQRSRLHFWSRETVSFDSCTKSAGLSNLSFLLRLKQKPRNVHLSWHKWQTCILPFFVTSFSSQILYTAAGKENLKNYNLVTDTPLYVTALQSGINASEVSLPCTALPGQAVMVLHVVK